MIWRTADGRRKGVRLGALLVCASLGVGFGVATVGASPGHSGSSRRRRSDPSRPNIVFVLTDDLSLNLLRFMPHVRAMERDGMTFRNYFVSDSLCCPSRASIFTGDLPHDSHVWRNAGRDGGIFAFDHTGDQQRTFALALQRAGYLTAMVGKYLNRYMQSGAGVPRTYVPPGWSEWDVGGLAYPEFNYSLNENGAVRFYGHAPSDYLTDVLSGRGVKFIEHAADSRRPFFLELAPFAPHSPYTPAPRDANRFAGVHVPRPPNFDVLPTRPPHWLAGHRRLTAAQIAQLNGVFRRRVQSVQAIDRMLGEVEAALSTERVASKTYIVFSSDNGFHTGEHRLMPGKLTAFDTDIRVPLVVVGPGVPAAKRTNAMAENVDLAETFAAIGGAALDADGHSLLPVLNGQHPRDWRDAILIEHHGPAGPLDFPDLAPHDSGNPPAYEAIRGNTFLYVEYRTKHGRHPIEYYNLRHDPFELHNIARALTAQQLTYLHTELVSLERCHGEMSCWTAMHIHRTLRPAKAPKRTNKRDPPAVALIEKQHPAASSLRLRY
jgi:N-acetylglucosamine-6-sulfatase